MGRDLIRLCNMQFYGRHGVNPEEQVLGQRFEVDVDLRVDTRPAALQDDLRLTINYAQVYKAVKQIVEEERFDLIETLAETIAMHIGRQFAPESVRVCTQTARAHERRSGLWLSTSSARKNYGSRLPRFRFQHR